MSQLMEHVVSGVKVRFSPVQHPLCLNLELDFWFSSDNSLNFELNLQFRFSSVRTRFEPIITKEFLLKGFYLLHYLHIYIVKFEACSKLHRKCSSS
jgi:hypothetical protein